MEIKYVFSYKLSIYEYDRNSVLTNNGVLSMKFYFKKVVYIFEIYIDYYQINTI